jgi:tape measure domain-containing protein
MAIREELTLGIQNFQANLDKARADVRKTAGEMSRDIRRVGGGPGGAAGGGGGGGILGMVIGSVRAFAPALTAVAAFRQGVEAVSVSMERQRAEMALGAVSTQDVGDQLDRLRELGESPGLGFDQVVAASTRLQAVGISAELAEKAILEMGNALALVGGGKEQLDGIMLAMTQIVAKGVISAEEINQIAERLPQIRRLMQDAFGTADTEALQKLGIGSEEFIAGIVEAAGELERADNDFVNGDEQFEG